MQINHSFSPEKRQEPIVSDLFRGLDFTILIPDEQTKTILICYFHTSLWFFQWFYESL